MNEEGAFLSAILASPDDDTARLVYADWLDEHDDPRGEFLRAAVTLRTTALTDEQVAERRRRILELRPSVPSSWLVRALRDFAEDDVREAVFRNAFGNPADVQFARDPVVGPFVQVEEGRDPSWYLLERLAADYPGIRPGSAVEKRDGFFFEEDGVRGAMFSIDRLDGSGRDRCNVDFGVVVAPLMGNGRLYRVELQGEQWVVTHVQGTWIS